MDMDLRIPVGLLFVILGLIMGIFGLTSSPALYAKSLDINVNLYWGIVELIFGSIMIAFGRSANELAEAAPIAETGTPERRPTTVKTTRGDLPPGPPARKPPVWHG